MNVGELKKFLEENNVPDDMPIAVWNIHYGWSELEKLRIYTYMDGSGRMLEING